MVLEKFSPEHANEQTHDQMPTPTNNPEYYSGGDLG